MKWFVDPDETRLQIGGGEWVDVKTRLTHGERDEYYAAMSPLVTPGERMQLKRQEVRTALVNAYLIHWSLTRNGKAVQMSPDLPDNVRLSTIRSLSPAAFDAIHRAIDQHEDAIKAADEGNEKGGEVESLVTSPSPEPVTGDTKTS